MAAEGGDDKLVSVAALGALVVGGSAGSRSGRRATLRQIVGDKRPLILDADLGVFAAGVEAGRVLVGATTGR